MSLVLETSGLSIASRLKPFDVTLKAGEFVGLIGPNGAGKTSWMRAALGLLPAQGHSSLLRYAPPARPRHAAYLPQERQVVWPILVRDLVALGARAHPDCRTDGMDVARATLARLDLSAYADRPVNRLSGGEKARVLLARALAQNAPLLIADEPCAALDPAQAHMLAKLMRQEAQAGRTVLASLHDLPLAARWCDRVLVMQEGALIADGPPAKILTNALMQKVFSVGFERFSTPNGPAWAVMG